MQPNFQQQMNYGGNMSAAPPLHVMVQPQATIPNYTIGNQQNNIAYNNNVQKVPNYMPNPHVINQQPVVQPVITQPVIRQPNVGVVYNPVVVHNRRKTDIDEAQVIVLILILVCFFVFPPFGIILLPLICIINKDKTVKAIGGVLCLVFIVLTILPIGMIFLFSFIPFFFYMG